MASCPIYGFGGASGLGRFDWNVHCRYCENESEHVCARRLVQSGRELIRLSGTCHN